MAARSPAFSIAGPDVALMLASISLAMILARVVLPSPGGPKRRTWSSVSRRLRAAAIEMSRFSLTFVLADVLAEQSRPERELDFQLFFFRLGGKDTIVRSFERHCIDEACLTRGAASVASHCMATARSDRQGDGDRCPLGRGPSQRRSGLHAPARCDKRSPFQGLSRRESSSGTAGRGASDPPWTCPYRCR